jgi:tetratricopeptide (TPR) repeat protein
VTGSRRDQLWGAKRLLPFVLLAGGYLGLRHLAVGGLPFSPHPFADLLRGTAFLVVKYLQIMFVPDAPVTMYLHTPGMFAAGGRAGTAIMLSAGGLLLAGIVLWRLNRQQFFWYVWFFVWIAFSFNVGSYANYLMAEKGLYLASLGPCVLLAQAAISIQRGRVVGIILLFLLVGWHAGQVVGRSPFWANSVIYLENIIAFEPGYDVAHYQLALLSQQSGDYRKALRHFDTVADLRPDLRKNLDAIRANAYTEWGRVQAERGDLAAAMTSLQTALRYDPQRSATWNALGVVNFLRGDRSLAASNWRQAVALDPLNDEAVRNLQMYGPKGGESATP